MKSSGRTSSARLIGLHHSPWTELARWALDHHGFDYAFHEYLPVLGEIGLRLRLRAFTGKVTVPVFVADDVILRESLDIVRYAEAHGAGAPLLPPALRDEALAWAERADAACAAGRGLYVSALLASPDALQELAPPFIPRSLRPAMARFGTALFKRKHGLDARSRGDDEAIVCDTLDALRASLRGDYILGELTLADLAMALVLQHVSPVDDAFIHLTPAARACSQQPGIAAKYPDLIVWRDRLYARHRRGRGDVARPVIHESARV